MKQVLIDTSGFYAVLDRTDLFHSTARKVFERAEEENWVLFTSNYVVQESWALIQFRLGWDALDEFLDILVPLCEVIFVDETLHALGVSRCRQMRERKLSLTDCVSFEIAQQKRIKFALACDGHFSREKLQLPI